MYAGGIIISCLYTGIALKTCTWFCDRWGWGVNNSLDSKVTLQLKICSVTIDQGFINARCSPE